MIAVYLVISLNGFKLLRSQFQLVLLYDKSSINASSSCSTVMSMTCVSLTATHIMSFNV